MARLNLAISRDTANPAHAKPSNFTHRLLDAFRSRMALRAELRNARNTLDEVIVPMFSDETHYFIEAYQELSPQAKTIMLEEMVETFIKLTRRYAKFDFTDDLEKMTSLAKIFAGIRNYVGCANEDEISTAKLLAQARSIIDENHLYQSDLGRGLKAVCVDVVWVFTKDLDFLKQKLQDEQTAKPAVALFAATKEGRETIAEVMMGEDTQTKSKIHAALVSLAHEKTKTLLLGWFCKDELKLAALSVLAERVETWVSINFSISPSKVIIRNQPSNEFNNALQALLKDENPEVRRAAIFLCVKSKTYLLPQLLDAIEELAVFEGQEATKESILRMIRKQIEAI